jgi:hypothetical protein
VGHSACLICGQCRFLNLEFHEFTFLQLRCDLLHQIFRRPLFANPYSRVGKARSGSKSSQVFLVERCSLMVGYRFFVPQSKQVINTVVPSSDRVLTRQFTPGTRRAPQLLQIDIFCSLDRRTPAFIPIRRANSTYRFERGRSVGNSLFARSRRISIRSRAIFRMLPFLHANVPTDLRSAKCSCNLFCGMVAS